MTKRSFAQDRVWFNARYRLNYMTTGYLLSPDFDDNEAEEFDLRRETFAAVQDWQESSPSALVLS